MASENMDELRGAGLPGPLRIALVCPGVGVEQRGFERLFADLFEALRGRVDVTLFKGGGATSEREIVLPFARRNGRLVRAFPIHALFGRTRLHSECATFALALLPRLRADEFDVVHCIDPPLARALWRLRRALHLSFTLVYTEGTSMPPSDYPPCDFIHHISPVALEEAKAHGWPAERMALLQPGAHRFVASASRENLRRAHAVEESTFLVLYVGAVNRPQKRVDYLIDEATKVSGDVLFWLDGSLDQGDPGLLDEARDRLGSRLRVSRVPSGSLGDLYAMADVLVMPSVFEAFGLVLAEALVFGLPVLSHDSDHFRWLSPNPLARLDMREPGALAARLIELRDNPKVRARLEGSANARERFDWLALAPRYVDMYASAAQIVSQDRITPPAIDAGAASGAPGRGLLRRSKFQIGRGLRRTSLLKPADTAYYMYRRLRTAGDNRRFIRSHPDFPTPPPHLAFDALNHTHWQTYFDSGRRHAAEFAGIIRERISEPRLAVLEWGCGPGRLLRHLAGQLHDRQLRLVGSDYNEESIEWCRANLQGIEFVRNSLAPPLAFDDDTFDVVYCFSVFTHLSEKMQHDWAKELRRVIRPGGWFICTTHGDRCRHLLTSARERSEYNCGNVVVQGRYREGRKWFLAVHPRRFVRERLLQGYEEVQMITAREPDLLQDIWAARKPLNGRA